ncbi:Hypothetical predicted protein [Pelobates cultripes]|uniref:Uncharacterized protein n=1 Tax=Pelobates cultripes TaxID=61616 RepID=A0AAD1TBB6_PELCU|nr:Hypothetical predicted protein [Pelobates cultripes]
MQDLHLKKKSLIFQSKNSSKSKNQQSHCPHTDAFQPKLLSKYHTLKNTSYTARIVDTGEKEKINNES